MSSLVEKILAKKVENGEELNEEDLLKWYGFHPELRPDGWVHSSEVEYDEALIPDLEIVSLSEEEQELNRILDGIDILTAYQRWGKTGFNLKVGSKRESIMIRCPDPAHPDNNPSAWINLDKQVYHCGKCEYGGDKFDLAAFAKGYPVPGYKADGSFPRLKREMAEEFGWTFSRTPGGKTVIAPPVPEPQIDPEAVDDSVAEIVPLREEDDEDDFEDPLLAIDWEDIIPVDTFMWEWMQACAIDDLPDEYYFWLGLQAIGTSVGPNVILNDIHPVKPNLYLCIYGKTGAGKSRSIHPFIKLVNDALPWSGDEYTESKGTLILPSPASAEALLHSFVHEIHDMSTNAVTHLAPVRGVLKIEEFASFVAKASRPGNPLKETLIELYDVYNRDVTHKSMSGGLMKAHAPYAQMLTTTQPKAIHAFMRRTDSESGFMNRWIFAAGARRRPRMSYGGVSRDLTSSTALLRAIHNWADQPVVMELKGPALKAWDDFYHGEIGPMLDSTEESMLSRIDLHLKKIILLLTSNEMLDNPTPEIVERATTLFPYLKSTLSMFSRDLAYDELQECQHRIMAIIAKETVRVGVAPSRRDLIRLIGKRWTYEQIERALKTLELLGMVELQKTQGQRGPATVRYVLNG